MGTFILPTTLHHTFLCANQEVQLQHKRHMGNVGRSRRRRVGGTKNYSHSDTLCDFP